MAYQYNEDRHTRDIRYNEQKEKWQWCLFSSSTGRLLKILMEAPDSETLRQMIKGWKQSEGQPTNN